ncbi:LGFP repeat-containing protein [Kineococcus xinjiangensis]|uniref:LGFP repeat-containing protein n=1 Tax=Kineococcus xinjiangensis TaxID=512762 RepID=A0A2S6IPG7_9ACTN|nr:LGFP repeat-containing protein [Kineococcus xinjiangensis]
MRRPSRILAAVLASAGTLALPVPAAPAATGDLVRGTVVRAVAEAPAEAASGARAGDHGDHAHGDGQVVDGTATYLSTGERVRRLTGPGVDALPPGSQVALHVEDSGSDVLRVRSVAAAEALPAEVAATPAQGPRSVRIVMAVPAGVPQDAQPKTEAQARGMVAEASEYWSQQTGGRITFAVTGVVPWYQSAHDCNGFELLQEAGQRAGAPGLQGSGHYVVIVAPDRSTETCSAGFSIVGRDVNSGAVSFMGVLEPRGFAHELGHGMGLLHANTADCARSQDVVPTGAGRGRYGCAGTGEAARFEEYGDELDLMGTTWEAIGSAGALAVDRLGLNPGAVRPVTASGTYDVAALPVAGDGRTYGLRVLDPGSRATYFVELRGHADAGSVPALWWPLGVRVTRLGVDGESVLLDPTPGSVRDPRAEFVGPRTIDYDRVLAPGATLTTAGGRVRITTISADRGSARVEVRVDGGGAPGARPDGSVDVPVGGATYNVRGAILDRYRAAGLTAGPLGAPRSNEVALAGGAVSHFDGGSIYWSPAGGARIVTGAIRDTWWAQRAERSPLGFPVGEEVPLRGGVVQAFRGGLVYWSPATGAHEVRGAVLDRYGSTGWENGVLGYPVTGERAVRGGAFTAFQGGSIYWSPTTGAHVVRGALRGAWGSLGWEGGRLGFPRSGEYPVPGGVRQDFQGGTLTFVWSTGQVLLTR